MTRGRYSTAAEARRAREDAEREVVAGREQIRRLSAEVADLRQTLAEEREQHTARTRDLMAMLADGVAPELAAARRKIAEHDRELRELRERIGREVMDRIHRNPAQFRATIEGWAILADVLKATPSTGRPDVNRKARRTGGKEMHRLAELMDAVSTTGHSIKRGSNGSDTVPRLVGGSSPIDRGEWRDDEAEDDSELREQLPTLTRAVADRAADGWRQP